MFRVYDYADLRLRNNEERFSLFRNLELTVLASSYDTQKVCLTPFIRSPLEIALIDKG